jgi:hypothetical protein
VLPSLGVFSLAGSFRCLFLLLFVGALYVAWVLFYVGLFSVRTLFFFWLAYAKKVAADEATRRSTLVPSDSVDDF